LKAIREAGSEPPAKHPDIDPPHEALQLAEHFREVSRLAEAKGRGEDFVRTVADSERLATDLESSLRQLSKGPTAESRKKADAAFTAVGKVCTTCHARYRDH
jgi:cytochrome c556